MYRLFKLPGITLQNASKMPNVQYSPRICLFCNFYHRNTPKHAASALFFNHKYSHDEFRGKRKAKKRTKKYAELLEVTESTTSNKKAAVQNLNAAQLSILVDKPEITLDKLHRIKDKYASKRMKSKIKSSFGSTNSTIDQVSSLTETSFLESSNSCDNKDKNSNDNNELLNTDENDEEELLVEELKTSGIVDETVLIKSSSLANSISEEQVSDDDTLRLEKRVVPDHLDDSEEKIIDKERKTREALILQEKLRQYNKVVLGYMDVCVNSNNTQLGTKLLDLSSYKKKPRHINKFYVNNIAVFNCNIGKLASIADIQSILEILQNTRKNDIKLNVQTYAHIFECIGRMESDNNYKLDILRQVQMEMDNDQITLNDVLTKSVFVRDQREFVDNMVKLLDQQFKPNYEVPDTTYDCRLLKNLNEENTTPGSTVEGILTVSDLEDRMKKQIEMEIDGQVTVRNISKNNLSKKNVTHCRNKLSSLENTWEKVALKAFKRNLATLKNREIFQKHSMVLHPYLSVLSPEDYIRILMREVRKLGMGSEMYSLPFSALCRQMGVQVYKMYEAQIKQRDGLNDKMSEVYLQYCDWFVNRKDKCNIRKKWTLLEHEANKRGTTLCAEVPTWQVPVHINIGKFLFNIIVNDLKLDLSYTKKKKSHYRYGHHYPAFFKIFRHSGIMLKEEVKPHPALAKLYRDSQPETLTFDTTLVPSLCPPRPWVSINNGGYIVTKTNIVRVSHAANQQWDRLVNTPPKKLYPALDSLNQLGSIPWTVNPPVLDIAIEVFQNNGSAELNMPQPPSVLPPIAPAPKDTDPEEKRKIDKARMELKRRKNEMYSLWCDALYRLSLANHFRGRVFWLPHNMDFRGRVYPVPPHLNHLGSDLARSILMFAVKKPLGPKGLEWLKLHTINLTGFKKRDPISERLKYVDEIIDDILDSAEKPLTGKMWWSTSDEPWQTLAACMEIAAALKSPNPEEFMSGFPIHQDGSCNGLQHYAALGRDHIGAVSVNLYPSITPQDVYSSVATMVDERRKEDAANGNHIAQVLDGFIKRKVIKQTVMTTVYGVTWFGAKLQIARQLKDIDDFPQEHLWPASTYLVQKTFQTLRTMFKSAREIQDWFSECARLVCISREDNMEWVTPLGLPVIQPYSKAKSGTKHGQQNFFSADIYRRPNVMKQKNAFAPNYVHSLDSSHMMLTSIHCEHEGITFVSVHDCYWTHACTVEIMNRVCREQFVALHSEPILEDLSKFLIEKFGFSEEEITEKTNNKKNTSKNLLKNKLNSTLTKVPQQGDFDLNGVLNSVYFFS